MHHCPLTSTKIIGFSGTSAGPMGGDCWETLQEMHALQSCSSQGFFALPEKSLAGRPMMIHITSTVFILHVVGCASNRFLQVDL